MRRERLRLKRERCRKPPTKFLAPENSHESKPSRREPATMLFADSAQSSAAITIHVSTNINHIDFLYEGSRMIFGHLYTCYIPGTGARDGPSRPRRFLRTPPFESTKVSLLLLRERGNSATSFILGAAQRTVGSKFFEKRSLLLLSLKLPWLTESDQRSSFVENKEKRRYVTTIPLQIFAYNRHATPRARQAARASHAASYTILSKESSGLYWLLLTEQARFEHGRRRRRRKVVRADFSLRAR